MNFLKKLFTKRETFPPADLSVLEIDLHSHFIPGIDDGAATMEQSVELLRTFQDIGYRKVITSPHVMSDFYRNTPEIILSGLEDVRKAIAAEGLTIEIEAAAEYYTDLGFEELIEQKNLLTFGDNYVLFELPFISEPPILKKVVFEMQMNGYKPVLAHPERYSFWYKNFENFQDIRDRGVLFQLNINSLTGHYSPETKKIAERLIKEGMIEFLGSDCHNMNHAGLMQRALREPGLHELLNSGKLLNSTL